MKKCYGSIVREGSLLDPLDCRSVEADLVDLLTRESVGGNVLNPSILKVDRLEGGREGAGQQGGEGGVDDLDGDGRQVRAHLQLERMLLQLQPCNVGGSEASETGKGSTFNNSSFDVSQLKLDDWTVLNAWPECLGLEGDEIAAGEGELAEGRHCHCLSVHLQEGGDQCQKQNSYFFSVFNKVSSFTSTWRMSSMTMVTRPLASKEIALAGKTRRGHEETFRWRRRRLESTNTNDSCKMEDYFSSHQMCVKG